MLETSGDERAVFVSLSNFKCKSNPGIESFLTESAIPFEKAHKCRTYFLSEHSDALHEFVILGFVSIALKTTFIDASISRSLRRRLDGIFLNESVPCYLIGQLAKNDLFVSRIEGFELLRMAEAFVSRAHDLVGGRFIRVDCENKPKVVHFYAANGYKELQTDVSTGLCQMVKFL